jgi:hypothetical protein
MLTTADGTTGVHGFACYEDRLVQVAGAWRIAARRVTSEGDRLNIGTAR